MKFCHLSVLAIFLLFTSSVFGQRLKDKRVKITYVSLPEQKLPDDFTTFSVNVYGSALNVSGGNPETAGKSIKMDGFKRVSHKGSDGGGHIRIFVNTGWVSVGKAELKSKKTTKKR